MSEIYVTGHRNPDTDSIVAAIAYANLRNALGDREYRAVRIGAINDETQKLLDRFGFEAPPLVKNMRTQVRDLDFDHPPALDRAVPIDLAWRTLRDGSLASIPIVDEDNRLYGMLSSGDIADYDMQAMLENRLTGVPLFNLLSVLEGTLVNEYATSVSTISGELFIALPQNFDDPALTNPDSVLICGHQPELIDRAIAAGVGCLIICRSDIRPEWMTCSSGSCIISTPLSARRVSRIIYQALPVDRIGQKRDVIVHKMVCSNTLEERIDEIIAGKSKLAAEVVGEGETWLGKLSDSQLLEIMRFGAEG